MKKIVKHTLLICSCMMLLTDCKKEEPPTPKEMLEGKWTITSQELLTVVAPGDGSYLTFNACSSTCNGTDYKASDASTGTFTYTMDDDATEIVINDTISAGGNYNYTWDILELTEEKFRITTTTFLGNLKIEMSKD